MLSYEKINFSAFCIREEKFEKWKKLMKNPKKSSGKNVRNFTKGKKEIF